MITIGRNNHRRVTWAEMTEYAKLVAAFYGHNGRDPDQIETDVLVIEAKAMVRADRAVSA